MEKVYHFPAASPSRLIREAIYGHYATLTDLKHGVLEVFGSSGGHGASREVLWEMLSRLETDIKELNTIITQQRITEDGTIGSYRRTIEEDYDWLGHDLRPNHLDYAGFRCPGCGHIYVR